MRTKRTCFPYMEPLRCHLILTPQQTTITACNEKDSTDTNMAITCDAKGNVSTTTSRRQSEEWYIILHDGNDNDGDKFKEQGKDPRVRGHEYHDQQNSSMITLVNCANGQYLISDRQGIVSASTEPSERQELWKMMRNSPSNRKQQQQQQQQPPSLTSSTMTPISIHENYSISSVDSGRYLSKSVSSSYLNDKGKTLTVGGEIRTIQYPAGPCSWCFEIEILSGELCFISSPWAQKQLSCSSWPFAGKPNMVSTWSGNEVWRFIEVGDGNGTVRIMRWKDKSILTSDASGKVYTIALDSLAQTQAKTRDDSKWMVDLAPDASGCNGVTFKSVTHNQYLQVGPKETIGTSKYLSGSPSVWHLEAGHRQQFFISCTAHDKRLTRDMGTAPNQAEGCNEQLGHSGTSNWGASEVWEVERHDRGGSFICLKSPLRQGKDHNESACKFLNSDQDGNIYETNTLGENALWKLESIPNDLENIAIVSKASGGYLSCRHGDFYLWTRNVDNVGKDEAWYLQPVLPGMVLNQNNHSKALSFLGGSALGMALGPLAVMGTVGAIGFGVGGIGAGSCAAWMMSLEGGATAAGGLVATMQSIGAAGLGATGVAASMTAGAVVGGSATTAAVEAVSDLKQKQSGGSSGGEKSIIGDPTSSTHNNRPFCDWKSW